MGMRIIAPCAAAIALLSLAVGCGGGGGESQGEVTKTTGTTGTTAGTTTAAPVLTKAVFIKRADSICSKADEQTKRELTAYTKENKIPSGQEPSPTQYTAITTTILIPALRHQVDEIRGLGYPAGDEGRIESFLNAVDAVIKKLEEEPAEVAETPRKLLAGADKIVAGYGFKVCG
jgi:hypothetical protein